MNLFTFPSLKFLQKHELVEYYELSQAILEGRLSDFEREIETHMKTFIVSGTFLVVEKLRLICLRNFIKRVYLMV